MMTLVRWAFGLGILALLTVVPLLHYRAEYAHSKRLHEVVPGVLYRCGQLTQAGLTEAIQRYQIRTVINAQDEYPDPDVWASYFDRSTIKESELLRRLGVRYVHLPPDLVHPSRVPAERPAAIDRLLAVLDDPANHPVLIHCRAGLHRTGCYVAVYRMEYEGWTPRQAIQELKANGFGEFACSAANQYILQYILSYRPSLRMLIEGDKPQGGGPEGNGDGAR